MNKWCQKEIAEMIESVADCKGPEEVCDIFDSVLTPREINDMARRLKILKMLKAGDSYSDIKMRLGVGSEVIARVSSKIGYGFRRSEPGVLDKKPSPNRKPYRRSNRGIYYKGVPSPGTMLRNLKKQ